MTAVLLPVALAIAAVAYPAGVVVVRRRGRWWPAERTACWLAGIAAAAIALAVPGHHDFTAHMTGHLLLGMVAPLLLVLAAPITLTLRALPVRHARLLSRLLTTKPVRTVSHPITAALLNAGGLWALYHTDLYRSMVVQPHILVAGYLFTAAVVGVDPAPHRPGRATRAAALIGFLAAHAILAKHLYGHPPAGVPVADARSGAQLMYYGGDVIDAVLIFIFCRQWYRATDPGRGVQRSPRIRASRPPRRPWRLPVDVQAR